MKPTAQLVLPGLECFSNPKPMWHPVPKTLAVIKRYLFGYLAHRLDVFAKRSYLAEKLGIKVRTLARYLKFLTESGWLETIKRTSRYVIRKVVSRVAGPSSGPSLARPSIDECTPSLSSQRKEAFVPLVVFLKPVQRAWRRVKPKATLWERFKEGGFA